MLARREHSRLELSRKLSVRGFDSDEVDRVLAELADEGLLSDSRFAETFARERTAKGYGPRRICQELGDRGIGEHVIERYVDSHAPEWDERIGAVRAKRFGSVVPKAFRERARQARFLEYRGFTAEQIRRVLTD